MLMEKVESHLHVFINNQLEVPKTTPILFSTDIQIYQYMYPKHPDFGTKHPTVNLSIYLHSWPQRSLTPRPSEQQRWRVLGLPPILLGVGARKRKERKKKKKEKEGIGEELWGSYTLNILNSQKSLK